MSETDNWTFVNHKKSKNRKHRKKGPNSEASGGANVKKQKFLQGLNRQLNLIDLEPTIELNYKTFLQDLKSDKNLKLKNLANLVAGKILEHQSSLTHFKNESSQNDFERARNQPKPESLGNVLSRQGIKQSFDSKSAGHDFDQSNKSEVHGARNKFVYPSDDGKANAQERKIENENWRKRVFMRSEKSN